MPSLEWSNPYTPGLFVLAGLVLAGLLLLARRLSLSPTAQSWPLLVLRAAVLGVLVCLLANPVDVSKNRLPPRLPSAVFLIDGSRSMALDRPISRIEQTRRTIADVQRRLPAGRAPRISQFLFGKETAPVALPNQLQAVDDETRLFESLERLASRLGDELPRGVFVFSDGRTTSLAEPGAVAELAAGYERWGVPIHVVPVGDLNATGDVAIRDLVAPREAPPGSRVDVKVVVGSQGYAGRRAEVVVRAAADPKAQPLAALPITLADGEQTHDLTLEVDRAAGKLVVEVPPLDGEAIVENNRASWTMNARHSKIRVIYMEGTGVNEYRWIRDALVEDSNIECLAMEVNTQYAERQMLHRIDNPQLGYPTKREELLSYDVVICSDISRLAFSQEQLDWTVELVSQRGGGFAMIGGNTSFGAGNWDQTTWDGMIPVDMSGAAGLGAGTIWNVQIRTVVPPDAESHPIWHIVDDPLKNHEVLARIPALFGTNRTDRLKPAATVLGVAGVALQGVVAMPIFTCQTYGRGRSFAMSSDSTVDWGRDFERLWGEGDNRYFRKFWRNVVGWLAENSRGKDRRLQVETDKLIYRPDEPIGVTARAFDDELRPTGKYRIVSRLLPVRAAGVPNGAPIEEAALLPRTEDLVYTATHAAPALELVPPMGGQGDLAARRVQIEVTAYDDDRQVAQMVEEAQLSADSAEFRDLRPDPALLDELAHSSGGKVLAGADDLAAELASYTDTPGEFVVYRSPLWDRVWLWGLLLALLTTEWIVRRLKGLA
jgi:uncharacterized membrane protein